MLWGFVLLAVSLAIIQYDYYVVTGHNLYDVFARFIQTYL